MTSEDKLSFRDISNKLNVMAIPYSVYFPGTTNEQGIPDGFVIKVDNDDDAALSADQITALGAHGFCKVPSGEFLTFGTF